VAGLEDEIRAGTAHRFDWWFEQWLHQGGAPSYDVSTKMDGRDVVVRVTQHTLSPWRLIIPLRACEAGGEENFSVDTTEPEKVVRLQARTAVSSVLIDPDALIPNLQARNLPEPRHSCP
jgi:aminopeptidase N